MEDGEKKPEVEESAGSEVVQINDTKVVFPPPSVWYKSSAADSRDNMWAYSAGGVIVLVKQKSSIIATTTDDGGEAINGSAEDKTQDENLQFPEQKATSENANKWPNFTLIGSQPQGVITAVSFCKTSSWDNLPVVGSPLVSGCDGGFVRVWNLEQNAAVIYHDNHTGHQVSSVDWSVRDHSVIYSIDDGGTMTVWNIVKNTLQSMNFGKNVPTCLHACPHEDNVVCFGTKGGNVFIVEVTGNGKILAKVRHEEEIVVTKWKPSGVWPVESQLMSGRNEEKVNTFPILASSTHSVKLPTVRIWNKHGRDLGVLQVWEKEAKLRQFKIFGPLIWARDPNSGEIMLISSGKHGEIIAWHNGTAFEIIHMIHAHNAIFAMVQCGDILWSMSFEPVIVGWNLRTMEVECVIPTFKGACTVAPSPVDSSRIAIGGTDSVIRVLKCTSGYPSQGDGCTKAPVNSHKLKGKVTAIAWHPTKDNCIGFGTDEGVLGIYELKENNKHATMFERRVHGTVYTVTFGPSVAHEGYIKPAGSKPKEESEDRSKKDFLLYACGGSSVFMVYPSKPSNPLISVSAIIEKSNPIPENPAECNMQVAFKASDIRWAPDYSYLAVGYNDGRIELYSAPNLKMRCWIKCHLRAIQYMVWRPFDFNNQSENSRWLASTSNDGTTRLYNLGAIFEKDFIDDASVDPKIFISSEVTFQGHGIRVISCAWSPHDKDLLVTVSYDCTAIVWNMADGSHIARYMEHQQRLVACCFHPIDPFKLITISDELSRDFSVHVWDYRDHPFRKNFRKKVDGCRPAVPIKAASNDLGAASEVVLVKESTHEVHVVQNQGEIHSGKKLKMMDGGDETGKPEKNKPKSRALLPLTANALINQKYSLNNELRFLVDRIPFSLEVSNNHNGNNIVEHTNDVEDSTIHLGLLGDSNTCLRQMQAERAGQEDKSLENAAILSKFMDDITWIEQAIKKRQVTESMLPIICSFSRQLYAEALVVFAEKLVESKEYVKACTYYLIAGKMDMGLQVLVSNKLYREAIAIMKVNFPQDDHRITEVMKKWVTKTILDGNYELAAKLYCSMGQYSNALLVIEKRAFPFAYQAGCFISSKLNDEKKLDMFGVKFIFDGVIRGAYHECNNLIEEYPALKWLKFFVMIHQCLTGYAKYVEQIKDSKSLDMWKMVLTNLLEEIKSEMGMIDGNDLVADQKKISANLLVSIAQNEADAQHIISKNLTLLMIGISDEEIAINKAMETMKLGKLWFEEKNFPLYFSVVMTTSMAVPTLKYPPGEHVPKEISACQDEVMKRVLESIVT